MRCGLLGEHLGHSYSPRIHAMLGNPSYQLFEVAPQALEDFLRNGEFDGINVTIPYKKAVIPYCADLSETAARIGSVNTVVRRPDGTLFGHNTDYDGFSWLLRRNGGIGEGEKAIVLGTGGASLTVQAVLRAHGAEVVTLSRRGESTYATLDRHADAVLLVNATPVGMYPNNGERLVDLEKLPRLRCVLDLIYNPSRTRLLLDAQRLGIACEGGLPMLVAQATAAAELFSREKIPESCNNEILCKLDSEMKNIILIGMPGCGKSTVGRILAKRLKRPFFDADREIIKKIGCSIPEFFATRGESAFRAVETQVLSELGKRSACVIATGGGCVTREENYDLLHQNGTIIWVRRGLSHLSTKGRPVSQSTDLATLYQLRRPLYEQFADRCVENDRSFGTTALRIMRLTGMGEK